METSLLVAQIFGPIYVVIALGMMLNKGYYNNMIRDFMKNDALLYLGGIIALAIGLLIVQAHNYWVKDWTVLVTIIGWMAVLKGIWLLVFPDMAKKQTKAWMKGNMIQTASIFAFVLGVVFVYFGYLQ
jgi:uncharacterized protein YjeT (DUF2065 family)